MWPLFHFYKFSCPIFYHFNANAKIRIHKRWGLGLPHGNHDAFFKLFFLFLLSLTTRYHVLKVWLLFVDYSQKWGNTWGALFLNAPLWCQSCTFFDCF